MLYRCDYCKSKMILIIAASIAVSVVAIEGQMFFSARQFKAANEPHFDDSSMSATTALIVGSKTHRLCLAVSAVPYCIHSDACRDTAKYYRLPCPPASLLPEVVRTDLLN